MRSNLSDVQQRVNRYWYTDGLGELIGGSMFILLGVYFALQDFLGPEFGAKWDFADQPCPAADRRSVCQSPTDQCIENTPNLSSYRICGIQGQ